MWDTTLKVLRDPLFAVGLSILLAVLASRVGGCLVRLTLGIGAVAAFIWLLVRFEPFENVVVSIVSVLGTVLVVLLICLALIAVIGILAVHSMHRRETQREARRTHTPLPPRERTPATETVETQSRRLNDFLAVHERLEAIFETVFDIDDVSPGKGIGRLAGAYFSGLTPYMPEIRELRDEVDALLRELAASGDFDLLQPERVASARTYLPSRAELAELFDEEVPWYAYWGVRLLCVHRQWRVLATVFVKCQYGVVLTGDAS
jgi:hypothetical protein